jgi:hypothetical protein
MLTLIFSFMARLRRKFSPANDNENERAVFAQFGVYLARALQKGHHNPCRNPPPSVRMV